MGRDVLKSGSMMKAWEKIIESADQFNVAWGFNAGYIKAEKLGLEGEAAIRYADDFAFKTQAIYDRAFVSPILRNRVVQTAVPFQTFTTNLFQWVTKDILKGQMPVKGAEDMWKGMSQAQKIGAALRFLGTAYAINMTYESIGLSSPWDLKTVIPFSPAVAALTGEAIDEPYGAKTMQYTFIDPLRKVVKSLMADDWSFDDPDFRSGFEGAALLHPYGFGLQGYKSLSGLLAVIDGRVPVKTRTGEVRYATLRTPADKLKAMTIGERKTDAYKRLKGEWERQPSSIQSAGDLLFPRGYPPYEEDV